MKFYKKQDDMMNVIFQVNLEESYAKTDQNWKFPNIKLKFQVQKEFPILQKLNFF